MNNTNCKYFITLAFVLSLGILLNVSHASFSERLYCQSRGDSVRVYLFEEEGTYKCDAYLAVLNTNLKQEYSLLLQIMHNLGRGDDRQYRQELYDSKKLIFLKLFSQIKQIETALQDFQMSLLKKCQEFIFANLEKEKSDISTQISVLQNQDVHFSFTQQSQIQKLESYLATIQILQSTEDIDAFIAAFDHYFSFKYGKQGK